MKENTLKDRVVGGRDLSAKISKTQMCVCVCLCVPLRQLWELLELATVMCLWDTVTLLLTPPFYFPAWSKVRVTHALSDLKDLSQAGQ